MSTQCIIVNMGQPLDRDRFDNERIIPESRRPKYVHDDLESAETEALRLHQKHAGPAGRFVIFQAVQATAWRTPFEVAASTVAVLEPYSPPQPFIIPERAPRKKRRNP
jgi:hypothetical protein